jgi:hypothetical protein
MADKPKKRGKGNKHPDEKDADSTKQESHLAEILPAELIDQIPEDAVRVMDISFSLMRWFGPQPSPIPHKLTEEHITDIIASSENESIRVYDDRKSRRRWAVLIIIIALTAFGLFTYFLANKDPDIYFKAIEFLVLVAGGLGAGIGLNRLLPRNEG